MRKTLLIISLTFLFVSLSKGQGTSDLMRLSQTNYSMATGRSSAMAGAFTSLGADPISMSVNPAGLGMYSSGQITFTPGLIFQNGKSFFTSSSGSSSTSSNTNKVALGNFAFVLGGLADGHFTLGLGYNRLNDFSGKSKTYGFEDNTSMGQMFMEQLNGIPASEIGSPEKDPYQAFYRYNAPTLWNGIMAYQSGLINPTESGDQYNMAGIFNYHTGDTQSPQSSLETSGALHEYTLSGAYNYKNKLYFGLTLSVQNLIYSETYYYSEVTNLNNSGSLDNYTLKQTLDQNGIGFNLKVGATLNLGYLRIGVAYHSPTWGNFNESSYASMTVYDKELSGYGFSDTPILANNYKYTTPSHFLAGISGTIAKKLIISADWELVTYGSMKYRSDLNYTGYRGPTTAGAIDNLQNASKYSDQYKVDVNQMISDNYKSAYNLRFALEFRPIKQLFLRVGYAYQSSMYQDSSLDEYGKYNQYSGGIGLKFKRFSLDLSYVHGEKKDLPSQFFKYIADDGYVVQSAGYSTVTRRSDIVLLTFGFKTF